MTRKSYHQIKKDIEREINEEDKHYPSGIIDVDVGEKERGKEITRRHEGV